MSTAELVGKLSLGAVLEGVGVVFESSVAGGGGGEEEEEEEEEGGGGEASDAAGAILLRILSHLLSG